MRSENTFFIDRKKTEVGLSEGALDTQEIKSYFYNASIFFGYPILYTGQMDRELLVSTAMYTILDGTNNGVSLYRMNSYLPANNAMWSASKKSIVYIEDFSNQMSKTKQIRL